MTGRARAIPVGDARLTVGVCEARRISAGFIVMAAAAMVSVSEAAQQGPTIRQPLDSTSVLTGAINGQVPRRPKVVGSAYSTAESMLRALSIVVVRGDVAVGAGADGVVLGQSPAAGTIVAPGAVDTLTVSRVRVAQLVTVPRVLGSDAVTAQIALTRGRLRAALPTLEFHDRAIAGTVFQQAPSGGDSVSAGTVVHLWVSRGPRRDTTFVIVPRVLELNLERARERIEAARLTLGLVDTLFHAAGTGRVTEQEPTAGDTARIGQSVRVTLSLVVDQSPDTGGSPRLGDVVDNEVDEAPPAHDEVRLPPSQPRAPLGVTSATPMPALIDTVLARAVGILNQIGVANPAVDRRLPVMIAEHWVVAAQYPLPGEPLFPSTRVQLRVLLKLPVPNLVGLSEGDAEATATGSGFTLGSATRTTGIRLVGARVVRQEPAPHTRLVPGTSIAVTVADPLPLSALLGLGVVALIAGAAGVQSGLHKPRFRTSVRSDPPGPMCSEDTLVGAEVALQAQCESDPPSMEIEGDSLILREERRDN